MRVAFVEALKMTPRSPDLRKPPEILAEPRFGQAFAELLTGRSYAEVTSGDGWDFAVEIQILRRMGLSDNDLRLLVQQHLVEYAQEVTTRDCDRRVFRPCSGVTFVKRTCFILTPLGIARALSRSNQSFRPEPVQLQADLPCHKSDIPTWDPARRLLSYAGQTVKQFMRPAGNQELVLAAFEEEGWPPRIFDPLAPHFAQDLKRRLGETIRSLNRGQANPLIRFRGDGTGEGIQWMPAAENCILSVSRFRRR